MNYRATPYLRLLLPFAGGIAVGCTFDRIIPGLLPVLCLLGAAVFLLARRRYAYRARWVFGLTVFSFLFLAGYGRAVWRHELRQPDHIGTRAMPAEGVLAVGMVCEAPARGKRLKAPFQLEAVADSASRWRPARGRVLLFIAEDSLPAEIRYGDRLLLRARIQPTEGPRNPEAFDYRRYLHFQNIHFQSFVKSETIRVLDRDQGSAWWRAAYGCRDRLLQLLQRYFHTVDAYAVASALLVGYKDALSEDLRAAYAETGSMHALAVSGTHVGFLYTGLFFLLGRLPIRGRSGYLFKAILILLAIWGFTLLTGATASVMRASVMFSFYLVGRAIRRDASVWNILAGSAFALLLWNPYFLFDAGFQLSYAAVGGMVFFYPLLYKRSPVLPRWLDEGWKVLLVGVAAQIGTLPLSLYYFHQFPCYFWLAGWVVVLGGAIFLWGGAVLVLLDALAPGLAVWLGEALYWLVWGMNYLILRIQELPGSVLSGIWLPGWATAILYAGLLFFMAAVEYGRARWRLWMLAALAAMWVGLAVRAVWQTRQRQIIVYSARGGRLIDCVQGFDLTSLQDSLPPEQIRFAAQSNRWALGLRDSPPVFLKKELHAGAYCRLRMPFIAAGGCVLAVIDHARRLPPTDAGAFPADVLLLSGNPNVRLADCLRAFPCKRVVADQTNSRKRAGRWRAEAREIGVPFHDIRAEGAVIIPTNPTSVRR
jgi:competence protein ComEC